MESAPSTPSLPRAFRHLAGLLRSGAPALCSVGAVALRSLARGVQEGQRPAGGAGSRLDCLRSGVCFLAYSLRISFPHGTLS